ncbi:NADH:flavin oxidoreductase [Priestia megaterium]|uniref:NADH:flavin oxidoreductase n=1 Tax=Priestia megaterium TaxID=1404 RepID=UPI00177DE428|nr:NADH:flavin oxidoreductase [Priestia megaterium]MBD8848432.1 NADH:flavin oxidoreductase [Priestia megaterium]MCF6800191.1 NADH:flavin oxidoreductase [Bacillus sp. ET1]MED4184905.1 NADH:flavin oxidoreductase [Priestia megaterium]
MTDPKLLFKTVTLGNITLNNRIGVAPMARVSATFEGLATTQMVSYYKSFARGGFGLIITEAIYTDDKYSQGYLNNPGLINEEQTRAWKKVVDSVHQAGAKIFAQIMHVGALSQGNRFIQETIGPSAVQPKGKQMEFYEGKGLYRIPREATQQELSEVINGFVNTAKRAKTAGFDGVEIHGANGYLLDQFLTDYTNRRIDEYGGSTENRVRLLVEVSKAVREAVGQDFTIGIRISQGKVNDYNYKWAGKEKDAEIIFSQLGSAGLDFIHVTEYEAWQPAFPKDEETIITNSGLDNSDLSLAALAKKYGKVCVIANGHLEDPVKAKEIIEKGEADIITLGKGALANHDWVNKVKNGEPLAKFDEEKVLRPDVKIKDFEV